MTATSHDTIDVDLLVLGAGGAGLTAALVGAELGMNVMLVEKTDQIGGTSARSAGSLWLPNTRHSPARSDSAEQARLYLREAIGEGMDEACVDAFLREAPEMVEFLEQKTSLKLRAYAHHPDYLASLKGATTSGRVLEPLPFDASVLGRAFKHLRSPLPEFMLFGGMMVDRADITHLLQMTRRFSSFVHATRLVLRYAKDRLRFARGSRLVMGNALIARLYHSLLQRQVVLRLSTETVSLTQADGRVTGAVLKSDAGGVQVRAKAGVVLATGGLSHHPVLRDQLMPPSVSRESAVVASVVGEGLDLAKRVGGQLSGTHTSNSFWAPVSKRLRPDGSMAVFPHFVLDRGKPGALAINPEGERFVNEAISYHLFGEAMFRTLSRSPVDHCYLLCDHHFIQKYGLGMVRPNGMGLRDALRSGYVLKAESLDELAKKTSVPVDRLAATIRRHNAFAKTGIDLEFAKGEDAYQQNVGDPAHRPNPCIGGLEQAPFYALAIYPGDIGASAGLAANEHAQVLDQTGAPVAGLYTCGNDMASIMAGKYPGPGITLGPGMTFGYIAAQHALMVAKDKQKRAPGNET